MVRVVAFAAMFLWLANFHALSVMGAVENGLDTDSQAQGSENDEATQTRIRELIYVLRGHRVFDRTDEWGAAIRELAAIGPAACPELLLELKNTERGTTMRGLLFTLRAIRDPRVTPSVIDAIPKAERLSSGSDCGVSFANADLHEWMKQHDRSSSKSDDSVSYGRPVNEIYSTLHQLTQQPLPDPAAPFPYPTWKEQYWRDWWQRERTSKKWANLRPIQLPERREDLVERDGIRRFGKLFPTGTVQRLGPAMNFTLGDINCANSKSYIDLDSGELFEYLEGLRFGPGEVFDSRKFLNWQTDRGVDLASHHGADLHLWLIEDDRWDTLDSEVQSDKPLKIGREAVSLTPFDKHPTDFIPGKLGTFLFTTREGGRGVIRIYPHQEGMGGRRIEYRLWERAIAKDVARVHLPPRNAGEWTAARTVILKEPGFDKQCLFDLDQGKGEVFSRSIFSSNSIPKLEDLLKFGLLQNQRVEEWARERGLDVATHQYNLSVEKNVGVGDGKPVTGLMMLDAREFHITPDAFDELTVVHAQDIAARQPADFRLVWMLSTPESGDRSTTYLFETKSGLLGLLQLSKAAEQRTSVTFRYKLARPMERRASENE